MNIVDEILGRKEPRQLDYIESILCFAECPPGTRGRPLTPEGAKKAQAAGQGVCDKKTRAGRQVQYRDKSGRASHKEQREKLRESIAKRRAAGEKMKGRKPKMGLVEKIEKGIAANDEPKTDIDSWWESAQKFMKTKGADKKVANDKIKTEFVKIMKSHPCFKNTEFVLHNATKGTLQRWVSDFSTINKRTKSFIEFTAQGREFRIFPYNGAVLGNASLAFYGVSEDKNMKQEYIVSHELAHKLVKKSWDNPDALTIYHRIVKKTLGKKGEVDFLDAVNKHKQKRKDEENNIQKYTKELKDAESDLSNPQEPQDERIDASKKSIVKSLKRTLEAVISIKESQHTPNLFDFEGEHKVKRADMLPSAYSKTNFSEWLAEVVSLQILSDNPDPKYNDVADLIQALGVKL